MENFRRILVVNTMSEYYKEAVQVGISIAQKYGSELSILHLISSPVSTASLAGAALNVPSTFPGDTRNYASPEEQAREELDKIIGKEVSAGLPVKILIREGKPVDEILQVVHEEKIDLMVLLSHEEGRLEHLLFGHDNDAILRKMPCSILLLKKEPEPVDW